MLPTVRSIVARLDPNLPVQDLKTLPQQVKENVFLDRTIGVLSTSFAALATLFGRWTWWPGGVPQPKEERRAEGVSSVPEAGD